MKFHYTKDINKIADLIQEREFDRAYLLLTKQCKTKSVEYADRCIALTGALVDRYGAAKGLNIVIQFFNNYHNKTKV